MMKPIAYDLDDGYAGNVPCGLSSAKFALVPRGGWRWNFRLWDMLRSGTVPVFVADGSLRPPHKVGDLLAIILFDTHSHHIISIIMTYHDVFAVKYCQNIGGLRQPHPFNHFNWKLPFMHIKRTPWCREFQL